MAALRGAASGIVADELFRPLCAYIRRHGSATAAAAARAGSQEAGRAPEGGSGAAEAPVAAAAGGDENDRRFQVLRSVGEECQTEQELRALLQAKKEFYLYDGFEPSGRMHIAQGLLKALNVNKCTQAGGIFIFWVADWFGLMNDKMGGDLEKIQTVGKYLIEVWKATGMDMSRVQFRWCADEIVNNAEAYWMQALDVARKCTLARVKKCCQIMGRKEDSLSAAQIMYPIMQASDIFFLKADICQLGVDQRKVNMLARDYCDAVGRKTKPVILSHHMLYGLAAGQAKMSKSNPDSAVFMEDTTEDVERKIRNAYCPREPEAKAAAVDEEMQLEKDDLMNPCLDYVRHILFSQDGFVFKSGGKTFNSYQEVTNAFLAGEITETALKDQIIYEINKLLDPVRHHFATDPKAKALLGQISQWKKENLVPPPGAATVRLQPKPPLKGAIFAVFAPLPAEAIRLEVVLAVLRRLRHAPSGSTKILWLEDWSAFTLGCIGGQPACIRGFYELLLFGLRKLAPDMMKEVRVCWQGETIVSGASEYWISVINAGRRSTLDMIRESLAEGQTLETASQVFAALMHIGDVLALTGASSVTLCCDAQHERAHKFAAKQCKSLGVTVPEVRVAEAAGLRLLAPGEGVEADVNIMLTDKEIEVNKKVKKAFCEPQNIEFCPPIAWVEELLRCGGDGFKVFRKPDNGGDKTYTDGEAMRKDFASGELHPGDLKPAFSKGMNALLEPLREDLKSQDVLKKAIKDLETFIKAQSKKK